MLKLPKVNSNLNIAKSFGKMAKLSKVVKAKVALKKMNNKDITQFSGPTTTAQSNAEQRIKIGNTVKKSILKTKLKKFSVKKTK